MTEGKQWRREELSVASIRVHPQFQFRLAGLDRTSLERLALALAAGGDARVLIRVARVGKILYVIHGAHRLAAYRLARRGAISAYVAQMSMAEATAAARSYGALHGQPISRADKDAAFRAYVASGRHLDSLGAPKTCRAIAVELGGLYCHETVRRKLNSLNATSGVSGALTPPCGCRKQRRVSAP